jgi:hypothetical protein
MAKRRKSPLVENNQTSVEAVEHGERCADSLYAADRCWNRQEQTGLEYGVKDKATDTCEDAEVDPMTLKYDGGQFGKEAGYDGRVFRKSIV